MILAYLAKPGLKVRFINFQTQKIDNSTFEIFEIVMASFYFDDKLKKSRFFWETFLLANTYLAVIFGMLFLTFNNADVLFAERKLSWKLYIPAEALPTTNRVQKIDWKKFAAAIINLGKKIFIVYMTYLGAEISIYLACKAQIVLLVAKKVMILIEYLGSADIFLQKLPAELSKVFDINKHSINAAPDKYSPYGKIYSLRLVELKTLKIFIKTNLANRFIRSSKFATRYSTFLSKS